MHRGEASVQDDAPVFGIYMTNHNGGDLACAIHDSSNTDAHVTSTHFGNGHRMYAIYSGVESLKPPHTFSSLVTIVCMI
jgi:hypothetical protein